MRPVVLLVIGLAITFTATLHQEFGFDLLVVAGALALIGLAHVIEGYQRREIGGQGIAYALGLVSFVAAIVLTLTASEVVFPVVIAAWAVIAAVLEFASLPKNAAPRQDAKLVGATGVLLAITVLLTRADLVAVIGFFGGYAVITGVFLGIAAFDARKVTEAADPAQLDSTAPHPAA